MQEERNIHDILRNLNSLDKVRDFIAKLGFSYADEKISTRDFKQHLKDAIDTNSLRIIGRASSFPVVFFQKAGHEDGDIDRQLIRIERELIKKLPPEIQDASIVVAVSEDFHRVHFINAKRIGSRLVMRRYLIGADQNMRTAAERLQYLKLKDETDWAQILKKVEDAFDREEVTETFFKDFEKVFKDIKEEIAKTQKVDEHTAHQFLHTLLNRLMFMYYVQRKGWLADGDIEFVKTLWTTYQDGKCPKDSFYKTWLSALFFSAFNNQYDYKNIGLPKEIVRHFDNAPYLNGGLFKKRDDVDDRGIFITDAQFERIFNDLLNHYNFTVTEDTPFDQNIAVDPEMLGIVYESLVNTTDFSDEKKDSGIFYTPRVEVDFMCRRSLVEYLANHTSASREDLYRFVFPEEGEQVVPKFGKKIREELKDALLDVTVVDPACGSGAFLVGMMQVVLELRQELARQADESFDEFTEKKRIIERSLYGVDVKEWAINVAQLRLWLSLIEVADERKLDLKAMKISGEALLPSLGFKLRAGDSLVQEIAGVTIPARRIKGFISPQMQTKITFLRKAKTDFYFNRGDITERDLKLKELSLYKGIIDEKIGVIDKEIKALRDNGKVSLQQELTDILKTESDRAKDFIKHGEKEYEKRQEQIKELEGEKRELNKIKDSLAQKKQLFWSIEFAEIFTERGGFDIVIGNPPYVHSGKIADPYLLESEKEPTLAQKRIYKEKLERMIQDDWENKFGRLNKKSDLYLYFYIKGLSLLNPKGTFCFISSNSWLDVEYGYGLQEFLLKHGKVIGIYDNEKKRSFKRADVNTIIAVLGIPSNGKNKEISDCQARFVMFKKPFEAVITSENLIKAESILNREIIKSDSDSEICARVVSMSHSDLWNDGLADDSNENPKIALKSLGGTYGGNKWGSKYLRAPDIYWTILKKCKDKLIPLHQLIRYDYGIKPGAVKFFYLSDQDIADWRIEKKYAKPALTTSQELESFFVEPNEYLFWCHESKAQLKGTGALKYIEWGEKNGIHKVTSVKSHRPYWYSLNGEPFDVLLLRFWNKRFWTPVTTDETFCSDNFFYGNSVGFDEEVVAGILNSTFHFLQIEIMGRVNQGQGVLTTYGPDFDFILAVDPKLIDANAIKKAFKQLSKRSIREIYDEVNLPDRQELDDIVFDALGLTKSERKAVYDGIVKLVSDRLSKAGSV